MTMIAIIRCSSVVVGRGWLKGREGMGRKCCCSGSRGCEGMMHGLKLGFGLALMIGYIVVGLAFG